MSRVKPTTDDDFDDFEAFDKDFDVDADLLSSAGEHARSRKQAAWQRLEQRKDVRRLREELEDWEDWDNLDSL
jgi:hypothetical protein